MLMMLALCCHCSEKGNSCWAAPFCNSLYPSKPCLIFNLPRLHASTRKIPKPACLIWWNSRSCDFQSIRCCTVLSALFLDRLTQFVVPMKPATVLPRQEVQRAGCRSSPSCRAWEGIQSASRRTLSLFPPGEENACCPGAVLFTRAPLPRRDPMSTEHRTPCNTLEPFSRCAA